MKFLTQSLCIFTVTILALTNVHAETDEDKGLEIAKQVELKDRGWQDSTSTLKMLLRNNQGEESIRLIRNRTLESLKDGDKSLTIFDNPRDVKGTVFLSFSHIITADDQWMYLPALKRVKRISSSNKSGPFMGSQFSYEDLSSFEVDKYGYKYIKDENFSGNNCYVVENYPKYKHSGYTRQLVWIDKQRYIPLKIQYYDRKNDLLKTLLYTNYQQYLTKYWRAHSQVMKNHQNGKVTELTLSNFKFRNGFTDRDFSKSTLKRTR